METSPIDTMRDCFLKFLSEGMTHSEALAEFDEEEFSAAAMAEINAGDAAKFFDMATMSNQPISGKIPLLDLMIVGRRERMFEPSNHDMAQALELTEAGWECITRPPTTPPKDIWSVTAPMSWQWRRPSKRPGKPGRKFLSTNQAWMAMKRECTPEKLP